MKNEQLESREERAWKKMMFYSYLELSLLITTITVTVIFSLI